MLKWTPTGRRLITGSQSGEFTLWNGQSFNFEMILQVILIDIPFSIKSFCPLDRISFSNLSFLFFINHLNLGT